MLQGIRDRAQGWLAWVIVILICIPFALWGVNEYFGTDPNVPVADVNGTEIPLQEFQFAYQQQQQAVRQLLRANLITEATLREQTIESMIADELLLQASETGGMRVSDAQLAQAILDEPAFSDNGRFSQERYDLFLRQRGMSPGRFEVGLRRSMLSDQMSSAFGESEITTETEVAANQALANQTRTFRVLVVPESAAEVPDVSDEAVSAEYEGNKSSYMSADQVRLDYIELSREVLMRDVSVDEDELRALYESRKGSYVAPEQRRASHILVRTGDDLNDEQALEKITAIKAELDGGADFAEVAKAQSDDPGSGAKGGDLGFFSTGIMDPSFEGAAFAMAAGELSDPVRSSFGWHLIKVTDIRAQATKPFEEARDEVLEEFKREKAEEQYFELAEQLANLAFENPDSLDATGDELGLKVETSDFITREGGASSGSVLDHFRVTEAAFSDPVLRNSENSDLIDLDDGRVLVLRVREHQEPRQLTLDEVRDDIAEAIRFRTQADAVKTRGLALLKSLRGGASPDEIASEVDAEWDGPFTLKRTNTQTLGADTVGVVFRMAKPKSGPTFDGVEDAEGAFQLIELTANAVDEPKSGAGSANAVRELLTRTHGQSNFSAFRNGIRDTADVTIFAERLASDYGDGYGGH
ncbi:MAG: SurA N-terminal domain-containing protein [Pseudomonadota bacterium]